MSQGNQLVERMRNLNPWREMDWPERCREAADRIEYLEMNAGLLAVANENAHIEAMGYLDRIEADAKHIADVEAERDALKARVEELEKALAGERERCAQIAEWKAQQWDLPSTNGPNTGFNVACDIADAIRASEGGADPAASPLSEGDER